MKKEPVNDGLFLFLLSLQGADYFFNAPAGGGFNVGQHADAPVLGDDGTVLGSLPHAST
jgi:hypothetical protein